MLNWRTFKHSRSRIISKYNIINSMTMAIVCSLLWFQMARTHDTIKDRMGYVSLDWVRERLSWTMWVWIESGKDCHRLHGLCESGLGQGKIVMDYVSLHWVRERLSWTTWAMWVWIGSGKNCHGLCESALSQGKIVLDYMGYGLMIQPTK